MYPVLPIGSLVLPTAPLIYLLGIYLSLNIVEWAAKALQLPATRIYEVVAGAVVAGFIAARLAFILNNFSDFLAEPLSLIWPLTNGYDPVVGFCASLIVFVLPIRHSKLPFAQVADAVIVGVVVAVAAMSIADGLARASLGTVTTLPWGVVIANVRRHPVAIYEVLVSVGAFMVWWRLSARMQPDGTLFLATLGVLSFGRFLTEAFRTTVPTLGDGYRAMQLLTLLIVLTILYTFLRQATIDA